MKICKDRKKKKLTVFEVDYIEKVLHCLCMENAKAIITPLPGHLKLTKEMCPKIQDEEAKMSKVPYPSTIGSLIFP